MLRQDARLQFLQSLTDCDIQYLLLSDFDLDSVVGSLSDLDICVPSYEKERFCRFVASYGFYERRKPAEVPGHYFYISHDVSLGFYLDVQYSLDFVDVKSGKTFLLERSLEDFLRSRVLANGFYRPAPYDQFLLYLAKCNWQKKKISARNINMILQLGAVAQSSMQSESLIGIDFLSRSEACGIDQILSAFQRKISFNVKSALKDNVGSDRGKSSDLFILFLGPDGVGKSSLIESVKCLSPIKCKPLYLGLGEDGWYFPFIKRFRKAKTEISKVLKFELLFWLFLFPLELLARLFSAKRSGGWCIYLVDRFPGRPFVRGGMWGALYRKILPKPDLIVLLTGDPSIITSRKPTETTVARTLKELEKWSFVAEKIGSPIFRVDTTEGSVETCAQAVLQEVMMMRKYQASFFLDIKWQD